MSERLDKILINLFQIPGRQQAQRLISEGHVLVNGAKVTKVSKMFTIGKDNIEISDDALEVYVGRGYLKLASAFLALNQSIIDLSGRKIADIGASTGGFTEYLLKNHHIESCYCVDVGHSQLALSLQKNQRITSYEGVNVKYPFTLPSLVDFIVIDLSFISLRKVLINIYKHLDDQGQILLLFKPQFESEGAKLNKGIILEKNYAENLLIDFITWCKTHKLSSIGHCPSGTKGKKGNQEYFVLLKKQE